MVVFIYNKDDTMKEKVMKLELEPECVILEKNEKIQDASDNEQERAHENLKTEWKNVAMQLTNSRTSSCATNSSIQLP